MSETVTQLLPANGDAVLGDNGLLAPGQMMPGLDGAGLAPLLQQLFDHAKGNAKALGDLIARAFALVIRAYNAFT